MSPNRKSEPTVCVGIIEGRDQVKGRLNGQFHAEGIGHVTGAFAAHAEDREVVLNNEVGQIIGRSPAIRLSGADGALFTLFDVIIGNRFHWERPEDQTFRGNLLIMSGSDGTVAAVNEIPIESYLTSVISSEMRAEAPVEFLKAHAIMSRSWLMAALERKKKSYEVQSFHPDSHRDGKDEVLRWYEREDHDLFDVCADDHCQRYQGTTKIISSQAEAAVAATSGKVMTYRGEVCDARYSKCCGGLSEDFRTAWDDRGVDYLASISDGDATSIPPITEEEAMKWILSEPDAYCNIKDKSLLERVLPDFDQETKGFFRWTVSYARGELEEILRTKSGIDFGSLLDVVPLQRGPSARICRLRIAGTKRSVTVGKELEIRRWLSPSHLYSSAFIAEAKHGDDGLPERFTFRGAGWGHGVGLCQIGAAAMASRGFSCEEILRHYFRVIDIEKAY